MSGSGPAAPRRLLVVSATIGEGHNATAAALEERARLLWPGCEIRRVDTLDAMGRFTGPVFRWIYRANVESTPWLYDFFYRQLWRWPWFAAASCRFTGTWAGVALAPVVERFAPDLVVSTYPLGTGGLDWLRRRGRLPVPLTAIISDFAPHPFWVYSEVDQHYVASAASLSALRTARPDARGVVGAPPVVSAFHPGDAEAARAELGLPAGAPVVLISCGSLGFGSVERAVDAALAAHPGCCVVAACGRNEALRARLAARGEPAARLVALGWTDRMPALTRAADVVVTNAGGATALEALATGRPVLLFEPIAGHGKANAALMQRAGLGRVCPDEPALRATLGTLLTDPGALDALRRRVTEHTEALNFEREVAAMPGLARHHGARVVSGPDALFIGASTDEVPQQIGAVLSLDEPVLGTAELTDALRERLAARAPELPLLRRRMWRTAHRAPRWTSVRPDELDLEVHVTALEVAEPDWPAAVGNFFDEPVPLDGRPPWRLLVLRRPGATTLLVKLHHALGDGLAVTAALTGWLADRAMPNLAPVSQHSNASARAGVLRAGVLRAGVLRGGVARGGMVRVGLARSRQVLTGLVGLARAGRAAAGRPPGNSGRRRYVLAQLPAARVRAAARARHTSPTALLLGVLAEALHRHGTPVPAPDGRLRTAVPMTARRVRRAGDASAGNDTSVAMLDLPVGPMGLGPRIDRVTELLTAYSGSDRPAAARWAVRLLGVLPAGIQTWAARLAYSGRFFSMISSVLPGSRRDVHVFGAPLTVVYPVLPLAPGVGLAVGFLSWGRAIGVGVSADSGGYPDAEGLARRLVEVFAELGSEAAAPGEVTSHVR